MPRYRKKIPEDIIIRFILESLEPIEQQGRSL
jgi:hypothetical protein